MAQSNDTHFLHDCELDTCFDPRVAIFYSGLLAFAGFLAFVLTFDLAFAKVPCALGLAQPAFVDCLRCPLRLLQLDHFLTVR